MLLYTLDPYELTRIEVIEEYISMVWTERFIDAGDVQLVMPATHANAKLLRPGTILNHEDSKELMILGTREIKDGVITVSGISLEKAVLAERIVANSKQDNLAHTQIVYDLVYDSISGPDAWGMFELWPELEMAANPYPGVPASEYLVEIGENLYDAVLARAKRWGVNIYIHRVWSETDEMYKVRFYMRKGENRTSANDPMDVVRFSPADDTLANVSELYSRADEVDLVIVYPPLNWLKQFGLTSFYVLPRVLPGNTRGDLENEVRDINHAWWDQDTFSVKFRHIETEDILTEEFVTSEAVRSLYGYGATTWDNLTQAQKITVIKGEMDRLLKYEYRKAKQKRLKFIAGEVPESQFVYGKNYHLGDIVETQGYYPDGHAFGGWGNAQISEYIRSVDENGIREYPTLSEPFVSSLEALTGIPYVSSMEPPVYSPPVPEQYQTTEDV